MKINKKKWMRHAKGVSLQTKNNKKMVLILLMMGVSASLLSGYSSTQAEEIVFKRVEMEKVEMREFSSEMNFSGTLSGVKETVMSMKSGGQIEDIKVDIGDVVMKGDLLAYLSADEVRSSRNALSSTYQNSLANLKNTESLMSQKVNEAKIGKMTADQNLVSIESQRENELLLSVERINEAEIMLDIVKTNRMKLDNTYSQKERDVLDSTRSAIVQTASLSSDLISYVQAINESYNIDNFEVSDKFGQKDSGSRYKVEFSFRKLNNSKDNLSSFVGNEIEDVLSTRDLAEEVLLDARELVRVMGLALDASVDQVEMTREMLSGYRNGVMLYSSRVEGLLLSQDSGIAVGVQGVGQALSNLKINRENDTVEADKQIGLIEQQVVLLMVTHTKIESDFENQISIIGLQADQAEQALMTAKEYLKTQAQNSKTQANSVYGSLDMANVKFNSTRLIAPYDAVVVEKYKQSGEVIGAGVPVLALADISQMKLVVYVPENYIKYIEIGTSAIAINSSFDEEFELRVERISPKTEKSSRKVRVEFVVDNPGYLKIGMYMDLKIDVEVQSGEVLSVKSANVQDYYDEASVFVNKDGVAKRVIVEVGRVSGEYVEIVDGVEDRQAIIKNSDNLRDGELIEMYE